MFSLQEEKCWWHLYLQLETYLKFVALENNPATREVGSWYIAELSARSQGDWVAWNSCPPDLTEIGVPEISDTVTITATQHLLNL